MTLKLTAIFCLAIFLVFCSLLPAAAQQGRVARSVDNANIAAVRGTVHPFARPEFDQGALDDSFTLPRMSLVFRPTVAQQAELDTLLREQQDPASPDYHKWLTPEQYADRFGLSQADLNKVTSWLTQQGFTVFETARSRTYVAFSGSVGQVRSVLRTAIHRYAVNGEAHFANVAEPYLPSAIAGVVVAVRGLHDFRPRPRGIRPRFTSSISGNHYLAPDDIATIYNLKPLYAAGIDGTGQKIVVVGQSDILLSDVQTFRSVSGLPAKDPQIILIPHSPDPGIVSGDVDESSLDVEWSGAVARNATIIFVTSGTNGGVLDSFQYAIDQNLAPVLTISYGDCEPHWNTADLNSMVASAQQASSQGMTILAASGDLGAADCDYSTNPNVTITVATHGLAVDVPSTIPNITAAGGTEFNEGTGTYWSSTNNANNGSALSYIPEIAWNDTAAGGGLASTGGGVSIYFSKPSWQTGTGVPSDGMRDVPDVSLSASGNHDGYLICSQGSCVNGYRRTDTTLNVVGGTSVSSPALAGIMALVNQKTQGAQGNANPRFYRLAATSTDVFHDIVSGDNRVPCQAGTPNCPGGGQMGYFAGVGYDQVTGLGSVDAANLVNEWAPISLLPAIANVGNVTLGGYGTLTLTLGNNSGAAVAISGISISGNFTQNNTCPGTLANGATCTIAIVYHAVALTTDNGTLTVNDNGPGGPHQVPVSATGVDPALLLARPGRRTRSGTNGVTAGQASLTPQSAIRPGIGDTLPTGFDLILYPSVPSLSSTGEPTAEDTSSDVEENAAKPADGKRKAKGKTAPPPQ